MIWFKRVSIHTPIQGVTQSLNPLELASVFQSTHPYRVWQWIGGKPSLRTCFNPHTHTGCDVLSVIQMASISQFQSTHPYRVWHYEYHRFHFLTSFNPHTHTGCDVLSGVMAMMQNCFNPHTHTGCDLRILPKTSDGTSFNPHTHTGCDLSAENSTAGEKWFQSTHPYRVWLIQFRVSIHTIQFQSTHPYRVWPPLVHHSHPPPWFQSTHPYRVWLRRCRSRYGKHCFNPHTHTGCDVYQGAYLHVWQVSIHTPIQGVTYFTTTLPNFFGFQSTHPYRVWLKGTHFTYQRISFNPHTHTGCDGQVLPFPLESLLFQSTHPYRVWPLWRGYSWR